MEKASTATALHVLPDDMKAAIDSSTKATAVWDSLTELTKNEWVCWVTIVKKGKTRAEHIERLVQDLSSGERRPCCWPGCPHRNPNAAKYFHQTVNS